MSLQGKIALVTGAGSGIGRASAIVMAARGATVVVSDLNLEAAEIVAQEIRAKGGTALYTQCDIGDESSVEQSVGLAVEHFGRLDVLHNNAALTDLEIAAQDTDILSIPTAVWDRVMAVTLRGPMLGCRYAVREMLKLGRGAIINTSSIFGVSAHNQQVAYGVAKAGVNMLTQYVATAYGPNGVRCNAVAPSLILTPTANAFVPEQLKAVHLASTLTPHLGEPEDIANIVAFLASDDARFITGQVVHADGGLTAHLGTYADARRYYQSIEA